jgi:hypothetical protein
MNARPIWRTLVGPSIVAIVASLLAACATGASPTPVPASPTSAATPAAAVASTPAAVTDQALLDGLATLWSTPYDAARVAALYAPDAVFQDNIARESSAGLEAIGAKVKRYADLGFKVQNTSAPIRQDNVIAVFQKFGPGADTSPGIGVVEIRDGKVKKMWEYPAGATAATASQATASPAANADGGLMTDLNAIWGGTADAAKVAAAYASGATFYDTVDGKTYRGLDAIQAKVAANKSAGFTCAQTSPAIRQDNVVAVFHRFSAGGSTFPVLAVFELKDGKVINQWAYPAP